ncbi:glycosyltransferase family 4 protein [Variovorax sp. LARHSF232]
MNLLFVQHNALWSNSGIHVTSLANGLTELGVNVVVAVPTDADRKAPDCPIAFKVVTWAEAECARFDDGCGPDLIHAWTPRQHVSAAARRIAASNQCRYVVHLEDNEHSLAASALSLSIEQLLARAKDNLSVPGNLAEPGDMHRFLCESAGVTALVDTLLEFKPGQLPGIEIPPAADDSMFYPRPTDEAVRSSLGVAGDTKLLVYHGNTHFANVKEVRALYLAVAALAQQGRNIKLIRLGSDFAEIVPEELKELEQYIVKVPFQARERLPLYLALADVFVQPGRIDAFNAYRFPSKLPEFFAMGRPVILPATNIGLRVRDGEEGLLLHTGDAIEIARAIEQVLDSPELATRLATGARRFYERELNWKKSASSLLEFYQRLGAE